MIVNFKRPLVVLFALAMVGALLASACDGGGGESTPSPQATATPGAEDVSPTPADGSPTPTGASPTPADASPTPSNDTPTPAQPSPTIIAPGGTPLPPSSGSVLDSVAVYISETGLDGQTYPVAQPFNCAAFVEPEAIEDAAGSVCADLAAAQFETTSGVIPVSVVGTDDRWEVTLELVDRAWIVTGAEPAAQ